MGAAPLIPEPVVEVVDDTPGRSPLFEVPTVELQGRRFAVSDRPVPVMSMMRLAQLAKQQSQREPGAAPDVAASMESLTLLYDLVRVVIADEAWEEFEEHATATGAGLDELQGIIGQAVEARQAFPTRPSSGSSGGRSTTGGSSAAGSSSPDSSVPVGSLQVQHDLEERGRPDLALVVLRAREASTTTSTG